MKSVIMHLQVMLIAVFLSGCSQGSPTSTVGNGTEIRSLSRQAEEVASTSQPVSPGNKTGVISDSMCGANHAAMLKTGSMGADDVSCTLKCIAAGSHFVLVDAETGKVYRLSDQERPKQFAGKKATVGGQINETARSIKVESMAPAP